MENSDFNYQVELDVDTIIEQLRNSAKFHDQQSSAIMNSLSCGSENWEYRAAHKESDKHSNMAKACRRSASILNNIKQNKIKLNEKGNPFNFIFSKPHILETIRDEFYRIENIIKNITRNFFSETVEFNIVIICDEDLIHSIIDMLSYLEPIHEISRGNRSSSFKINMHSVCLSVKIIDERHLSLNSMNINNITSILCFSKMYESVKQKLHAILNENSKLAKDIGITQVIHFEY